MLTTEARELHLERTSHLRGIITLFPDPLQLVTYQYQREITPCPVFAQRRARQLAPTMKAQLFAQNTELKLTVEPLTTGIILEKIFGVTSMHEKTGPGKLTDFVPEVERNAKREDEKRDFSYRRASDEEPRLIRNYDLPPA
ncbi:unnamed protein product, partial [Strongylus vulgaris]